RRQIVTGPEYLMRSFAASRLTLLAGMVLLGTAGSVHGYIGSPPLCMQFGVADCVVAGEGALIEEKTVMGYQYPTSKEKTPYHIVWVRVSERLHDPLEQTHVRVAVFPSGSGRHHSVYGYRVDQEACFMLTRHFDEPFFTPGGYPEAVTRRDDGQ